MTSAPVNQKVYTSQSDIARRMGMTRQAVNAYLTGKRRPGPGMAKKLEEATGIERAAWMYPDEHHNPMLARSDGNGTGSDPT